jgi:hypothetical protein
MRGPSASQHFDEPFNLIKSDATNFINRVPSELPRLILFLFIQKYIVSGVALPVDG